MRFHAGMGAEAVKKLLQDIDIDKELETLEGRTEDRSRSTS